MVDRAWSDATAKHYVLRQNAHEGASYPDPTRTLDHFINMLETSLREAEPLSIITPKAGDFNGLQDKRGVWYHPPADGWCLHHAMAMAAFDAWSCGGRDTYGGGEGEGGQSNILHR